MLHLFVELLELFLYLIIPVILVVLAFFFSVLLHELGHAVPMLLMTSGKVEVYVGSFGNPARSFKWRVGRLDLFFKYNPFSWRKGLCKPPPEILSAKQRILYTATGPATTLLLAITCWYLLTAFRFHLALEFWVICMLFACVSFTLSSLIPRDNAVTVSNGRKVGNDAAQIRQLLKYRKLPLAWWQAAEHMGNQRYSEAAVLLDGLLAAGHTSPDICRNTVIAHIQLKDYATATRVSDTIKSLYHFNADDYCNEGVIKSRLGQHAEAMLIYEKVLGLNPNHVYALNNLGYSLCLIQRDTEAILLFNKALALLPAFSHAYNNRGWAKINLGNLEEGLTDVNHSLTLDETDADAYRNIGLYHLKKKDFTTAITFFEKAKAMDADTLLVDQYLAEAYEERGPVSTPGTA